MFLEAAVLRTMRFPARAGGGQRAFPLLHPAGKVTAGEAQEVLAPLSATAGAGAKWEKGGEGLGVRALGAFCLGEGLGLEMAAW